MNSLITTNTSSGTNNIKIAIGNANNVYVGIINDGVLAGCSVPERRSDWTQLDSPTTNENEYWRAFSPKRAEARKARRGRRRQGLIHFSIVADPNQPQPGLRRRRTGNR